MAKGVRALLLNEGQSGTRDKVSGSSSSSSSSIGCVGKIRGEAQEKWVVLVIRDACN